MDVLLEVNVSGEATKHGFTPEAVRSAAQAMVALPGIRICGLMTMAPLVDDPEAVARSFVICGCCGISWRLHCRRPIGGIFPWA